MAASLIFCGHCGFGVFLPNSAIRRARKAGAPLFCGRECAGLARRKPPVSDAEKRAAKAAYDAEYRGRNAEKRRAQKAAYFRATYDPAKARIERRARMAAHVEYCRRPEYKQYKREYDRKYRAEQDFGPFAEAAMLLGDLQNEIDTRASRYEIYSQNGTLNKSLQRKRDYKQAVGR